MWDNAVYKKLGVINQTNSKQESIWTPRVIQLTRAEEKDLNLQHHFYIFLLDRKSYGKYWSLWGTAIHPPSVLLSETRTCMGAAGIAGIQELQYSLVLTAYYTISWNTNENCDTNQTAFLKGLKEQWNFTMTFEVLKFVLWEKSNNFHCYKNNLCELVNMYFSVFL